MGLVQPLSEAGRCWLLCYSVPVSLLVTMWLPYLQHHLHFPGRRKGRAKGKETDAQGGSPSSKVLSQKACPHLCLRLAGRPTCYEAGKWVIVTLSKGGAVGRELDGPSQVRLSQSHPALRASFTEHTSHHLSSFKAPLCSGSWTRWCKYTSQTLALAALSFREDTAVGLSWGHSSLLAGRQSASRVTLRAWHPVRTSARGHRGITEPRVVPSPGGGLLVGAMDFPRKASFRELGAGGEQSPRSCDRAASSSGCEWGVDRVSPVSQGL